MNESMIGGMQCSIDGWVHVSTNRERERESSCEKEKKKKLRLGRTKERGGKNDAEKIVMLSIITIAKQFLTEYEISLFPCW